MGRKALNRLQAEILLKRRRQMTELARGGVQDMKFKQMVKGGLIVPARIAMELKKEKETKNESRE